MAAADNRSQTGRPRGPLGLLQAWVEVLTRPTTFFTSRVSSGEQAPGLTFAMAVVALEETTRLVLRTKAIPELVESPLVAGIITLTIAVLLITPAALHLIGGVQTVVLMLTLDERGSVSETVQVIAYATAPCVVAGVPVPTLRLLATGFGSLLLIYGLATVHRMSVWKAGILGLPSMIFVFGYGFRGFGALQTIIAG